MIVDARALPDETLVECDIAIVGGGMAGLCLAKEFANTNAKICIFESGDLEANEQVQSLYKGNGNFVGPDNYIRPFEEYIHNSRDRYWGGTGNSWGGKCAELEVADFEERKWIEYSGWPFSHLDLQLFYDRACYYLRLPSFRVGTNTEGWQHGAPLERGNHYDFTTAMRCFSSVTGTAPGESFDQYKTSVTDSERVTTYLNANIVDIHTDELKTSVDTLLLKCLNGKAHQVKARFTILATGGLEVPRILLNSRKDFPEGLGNQNDVVGRFFSGHFVLRHILQGKQSQVKVILNKDQEVTDKLKLYIDKDPNKAHGLFSMSRKAQWRERMSDFAVTFEELKVLEDHIEVSVFVLTEQYPNPDSRITLSDEVDELGLNRLSMHWTLSQRDVDNVNKGLKLFDRYLKKMKLGFLSHTHCDANLVEIAEASRHHMGATRMHEDPTKGVVDSNCQVHGVNNLFIAGTSVFPTGGLANPTLTVMALAIKMADHIKLRLN